MYMFFSKILVVISGFAFWWVAATLYPVHDIGVAVALYSSATLILFFSVMGLESSMIRFLPLHNLDKVINTSIILIIASSSVLAVLYILSLWVLSLDQYFTNALLYVLVFIVYVIISSVSYITGYAFIAMRKTEYYFAQNLFTALRVLFLVPLFFLGSLGIFVSLLIAYSLSLAFTFYTLRKFMKFKPEFDKDYISRSFKFSSGNYIATMLFEFPGQLLPTIVLGTLGATAAALFFVGITIGGFLMQVTAMICMSLFVEGSNGENLKSNVMKAGKVIYSLLIPGFLILFFFGDYLLQLYGSEYTGALDFLRLIALASFFNAIYWIYNTIQNVRMQVKKIIKMNLVFFALFPTLAYVFMLYFGVVGIGYGVILTYLILDVLVIVAARKEGWL
jgi:O-antigen/teichoic acid export membrane protein